MLTAFVLVRECAAKQLFCRPLQPKHNYLRMTSKKVYKILKFIIRRLFMLRKLSVVMMFLAVSSVFVYAQRTPSTPPTPPVGRVEAFGFGSLFDGSYLGVETKEISKDNFSQYGLREVRGVAVEKVTENSPAERAGLQNGDVIVRFDGMEVTSVRKLSRLIAEVAPDHQATLTVVRGGREMEIRVTMGRREFPKFEGTAFLRDLPQIQAMPNMARVLPPSLPTPPSFEFERDGNVLFFGSNRQIGITATSLSDQLGEYFGVPEGKGVLISTVRENSPASRAGLKAGDVVVEVDGKEVKSSFDLTRLVNERKDGAVNLTVIRNKSRINVSVEPEKSDGKMRIVTPDQNGNIEVSPKAIVAPGVVIGNAPGIIL